MSTYEISKSSLLSLKAEILRKHEELNKTKVVNETKKAQANKNIQLQFKNKGIEQRNLADISEEEENLLKKSRIALESKAKLYEKLSKHGNFTDDELELNRRYLVSFDKKNRQNNNVPIDSDHQIDVDKYPESDEYLSDEYEPARNPDEEWVDYTDCLGRTRKCMRKDLEFLKSKDDELRASVDKDENKAEQLWNPDKDPKQTDLKVQNTDDFNETNELLSNDMRREFLRRQWEKEESELREKDNIHYQDILFNEARTHGVGYYGFSKDEEERAKQQEALKNLRQETKQEQQKAQELKNLREKQLAARVKAAKNRKRARMGLPPEEDEPEVEQPAVEPQLTQEEQAKIEKLKQAEQTKEAARKKHIRPWDIGKEGIREHYEHTQGEWVDKKRKERPKEFAPPRAYHSKVTSEHKSRDENYESDKLLYFSTKKDRSDYSEKIKDDRARSPKRNVNPYKTEETFDYQVNDTIYEPTPIIDECVDFDEEQDRLLNDYHSINTETNDKPERKRGVEIAPPPTFDYYGPNTTKKAKFSQKKENLVDSIAAGLKFLREQAEKKETSDKHPSEMFLL